MTRPCHTDGSMLPESGGNPGTRIRFAAVTLCLTLSPLATPAQTEFDLPDLTRIALERGHDAAVAGVWGGMTLGELSARVGLPPNRASHINAMYEMPDGVSVGGLEMVSDPLDPETSRVHQLNVFVPAGLAGLTPADRKPWVARFGTPDVESGGLMVWRWEPDDPAVAAFQQACVDAMGDLTRNDGIMIRDAAQPRRYLATAEWVEAHCPAARADQRASLIAALQPDITVQLSDRGTAIKLSLPGLPILRELAAE